MTTRVALIGLGWAVRELWAPVLDGHPDLAVVAVHDADPAAVGRALERFPGARVVDDPTCLGPDTVDLAVVATPNHLHASTAVPLLECGVDTFVEKPVCVSPGEAAALAAAERAGAARLLAGSAAWHRADVQALHALVPRLGALRAVELSWIRAGGIPAPGGWFTERRRSGGGALVDLGWHLITIGMRMLSWPPVRRVTGTVSADFLSRAGSTASWREDPRGTGRGGAPRDVEDTARGVLDLDGGPLVSVCAAWASHAERDVTRLVVEGADGRAELTCTFGLSPNGVGGSTLTLHRRGETEPLALEPEERGSEYRRQLDVLAAQVSEPRPTGSAVDEVVRTADIIDRFYASAGVPRAGA